MADGKDIRDDFRRAKDSRTTWNSQWQEVAHYVYPSAADFWQTGTGPKGERKNQRIYDSTAPLALGHYASILASIIIPRHTKWQALQVTDPTLMKDRAVLEWLDLAAQTQFRYRYRPDSNFHTAYNENFRSLGAFGNGSVFLGPMKRGRLRYRSTFIGDTYFDADECGQVDSVYFRFDMTNRQAHQKWGDKLPASTLKMVEKSPRESKSYVHCVRPNPDHDPESPSSKAMRFSSFYLDEEHGQILEEGGFKSMPYFIGRASTSPHETLGRGPGMEVLPVIRTLNEIRRCALRAAHKLTDPTMLAHDDGILGGGRQEISADPGKIIWGGVDSNGRQMLQPMATGARPEVSQFEAEDHRATIREAFLVNLIQILIETPRMTATEVLHRSQERGMLIGPAVSRIQSDQISPTVLRELDVLMENGKIPPPPPILKQALDEGDVEVVYDNQLIRLQRAEELTGIDTVIQQAVQLANTGDTSGIDAIDGAEVMRLTALGAGSPVSIIRSPEAQAARQQAREQAEAQQQEANVGQASARALKDVAQAQKYQMEAMAR